MVELIQAEEMVSNEGNSPDDQQDAWWQALSECTMEMD